MYGLCLTLWLYNTSPVELNLTVGVCATAHQSFQLTELKIKFKDGGSYSYTDGTQTKVRKLNPKEKEVGKMASCCRGQESRKYNSMNKDIPNLHTQSAESIKCYVPELQSGWLLPPQQPLWSISNPLPFMNYISTLLLCTSNRCQAVPELCCSESKGITAICHYGNQIVVIQLSSGVYPDF